MKKLYLIPILISTFFLFNISNVKATTYYDYKHFTDNYITCSTGYGYCQENLNIFLNNGNISGDLMFTFVSDPQIIVNSVVIYNSNNSAFTCNLGTQTIYSDNTNGYHLFTAICPGNANNNGFTKIRFNYDDQYYNGNSFKFYISDYYSFTFDATNTDYTAILNTINNSVNNLNTALGGKLDNVYNYVSIISSQISIVNGKLDIANSNLSDIKSKLDDIKSNSSATASNTEEIKNDIKSDNVTGAEGSADDLKNNSAFQDNTGLSGVISMPLTFVNSLTNTCQPIELNIPYMDVDVTIPCMQSVITDKMPLLANLIKIIVNGFIVYRILLDIFQIVRNAKNPEDDRIEVLDL